MEKLLAKYTMEYCVSLLEQDNIAVARLVSIAHRITANRSWDGGLRDAKSKDKRADNESQSEQKFRSAKA